MKCLLCNEDLLFDNSLISYLFNNDCICDKCRCEFVYKPIKLQIDGVNVESFYLYNDAFKKAILQYKECYDEALSYLFIVKLIHHIERKYSGYTIVLVPSSKSRQATRGFNHLYEIFKHTSLDVIDILYKVEDITLDKVNYSSRLSMKDNIKMIDNVKLPNKILLVDDILTSGNTIKGALKNFKNHESALNILVIAYNQSWQNKMKAL